MEIATAGLTEELAPALALKTGALKVPHCRDRLKRKCLGRFPIFGLEIEKVMVSWVQIRNMRGRAGLGRRIRTLSLETVG